MKAIIITIGDELLIGQVINTNAAYISERLNSVGVEVIRIVTIGDDEAEILHSLQEYSKKYDVIVMTGGLGPTHDDITKKALCKFFQTELVSSQEARAHIEQFLRQRNYPWSEAAEEQTLIPRGSIVIPNKLGTASGLLFEQDRKYVIAMPGVPYEMEAMVEEVVVPYFKQKAGAKVILHRTLKTTGIPESQLAKRLENLTELLKDCKLAFLPSTSGVNLRITVIESDRKTAEQKINTIEARIREKAEKYIYGVDSETLEEIVGKLLKSRKLKIAIAESCTGGLLADRITNVPGSSQYLDRAIVTYSNQSKIELLDVPKDLIEQHGAVSQEVAEAMASGIRKISNTDIGISTTGIAGPTGGTPEKPIGLVWIGYSDENQTLALKFHFGDGRRQIKERAIQAALDLVRRKLLKLD
ncbi:MAG: competence/damage-inducible protein A [Ignavibacteriae bacterium]|nr:competence/damage-inducible protein A [Ignavibacteriota bacterium]